MKKAYLDDIFCFSKTYKEHLVNLEQLLKALSDAHLSLQPPKCKFGVTELKFLGMVVICAGIKPNSSKIEAVVKFSRPKTLREVKIFLGMSSYYRKYIRKFCDIARSLSGLSRKETVWVWSPECEKA